MICLPGRPSRDISRQAMGSSSSSTACTIDPGRVCFLKKFGSTSGSEVMAKFRRRIGIERRCESSSRNECRNECNDCGRIVGRSSVDPSVQAQATSIQSKGTGKQHLHQFHHRSSTACYVDVPRRIVPEQSIKNSTGTLKVLKSLDLGYGIVGTRLR